jgi:hypothetical protein
MSRFVDKVAVVTSSTSGSVKAFYLLNHAGHWPCTLYDLSVRSIGFATVQRLAREGACVVMSSRNQGNVDKALEKLKEEGLDKRVHGMVCHVGKKEEGHVARGGFPSSS